VICEHPAIVTVGREGSGGHIRFDPEELAARGLSTRWVNRGGGCLLHAPGQLAIYPIVPLAWHGFSVGEYLKRLERGLVETLAEIGVAAQTRAGRHDLWGRTGQLAAVGAAVKGWTTYHGAFLNVCPAMHPYQSIVSDPASGATMSSLAVERQQAVRMPRVRESLVRQLTQAFGCQRYHLYTGHPHLSAGAKRRTRQSKVG
jgi:lipoyl(octanoyl) transferase